MHIKLALLNDRGFKHSFAFAYITLAHSELYIALFFPERLANIQKCQCLHCLTCKRADNHIVGKEGNVGVFRNVT